MPYKISFQLYSARNFPPLESQLEGLAAIGYDAVEPWLPAYEASAAEFRRKIDAAGLACYGFHLPFKGLVADPQHFIDIAKTIGARLLIPPYLEPQDRPTTADGWRAIGRELGRVREIVAAEGLKLAWHNHDFEYRRLPDGSRPIDLLFEGAGSEGRLRDRLRLGGARRRRSGDGAEALEGPPLRHPGQGHRAGRHDGRGRLDGDGRRRRRLEGAVAALLRNAGRSPRRRA